MRKLATLRKIASLSPIDGADRIEVAQVDGWEVVVQKNTYAVGDFAMYFEIDSVLPIRPEFEFLRKNCGVKRDWLPGGEGFRIKTIKLKEQISQGLLLPLSEMTAVQSLIDQALAQDPDAEPIDFAKALGIVKWDPPLPAQLGGRVKGNFPTFIPKTDEERIQNCHEGRRWREHVNDTFEISLKLDGSSCTLYSNNGQFGVCSRNLDLLLDSDNAFWSVVLHGGLDQRIIKWCADNNRNVAFQGELMGPGVQGNREGLPKLEFFLFNVWDIDRQSYLTPLERRLLASELSISHVPVLAGAAPIESQSVADILAMSNTASLNHPVAEGVVFKSNENPSFSFKAINNNFLLQSQ